MATSSHEPQWPVDISGWSLPRPDPWFRCEVLWSNTGRVYEVRLFPPAAAGTIEIRVARDVSYLGYDGRRRVRDEAAVAGSPLFGDIEVMEQGPFVLAGHEGYRHRMRRTVSRPPKEMTGEVAAAVPNVWEDIVIGDGPIGLAFEAHGARPDEAEAAYSRFLSWIEDFAFRFPDR